MDTVELTLTDEARKALIKAGALAFDARAEFEYIPLACRGDDFPAELRTVWTLRSKTGIEMAKAEDNIGHVEIQEDGNRDKTKFVAHSGSQRIDTLRAGIVQVRNLWCDNGERIEWKRDGINSTRGTLYKNGKPGKTVDVNVLIEKIRPTYQTELQEAIQERSVVSEEEVLGLE